MTCLLINERRRREAVKLRVKRKILIGMVTIVMMVVGGWGGWWILNNKIKYNPLGSNKSIINLNLEKYDFDNLRNRGGVVGEWEMLGDPVDVNIRRRGIKTKVDWVSKIFRFQSNGKWISGMVNFKEGEKRPTVIMVRGYAETAGYYPGSGSWKMADELAKKGMATVSIDFLGYGQSDLESANSLEARFEKVMSLLDLLETVKQLDFVDPAKIGFWAHSNGGQIVLSVLEATGGKYSTVLWAPMTNAFPQSVLETADEGDAGAPIRKLITDFEKNYDPRRYAFENYYHWIRSPVMIFQGTADVWCKVEWQQKVVAELTRAGNEAKLRVVEGDDHNFSKNWEVVAGETVDYYRYSSK